MEFFERVPLTGVYTSSLPLCYIVSNPVNLVVLSGEHPTLPLAEMRAVLDAHNINYRIEKVSYKLVRVNVQNGNLPAEISERAAFLEENAFEISESPATIRQIEQSVASARLDSYIGPEDSFSLRVSRFGGVSKSLQRADIERDIGGLVAKLTGAKVNLTSPQKLLRGYLTGDSFHLGLSKYRRIPGSVAARRPRKRAVFHPSTMMPKLARCMVNLSRVVQGNMFLDPFCGVGGLLVEASMLGCNTVGLDAVKRMVRASRRNLRHFNLNSYGYIRADARELPLTCVDAIATDPPYGTGASTLKSTTQKILVDFLPQARETLHKEHCLVIASPEGTRTIEIAENSGFKTIEKHYVYVHRRLTREILVLRAI
jgi:tRNA (guanine10-N2)-dimethyltransferase